MGNIKDLVGMIPGVGKAVKDMDIDENGEVVEQQSGNILEAAQTDEAKVGVDEKVAQKPGTAKEKPAEKGVTSASGSKFKGPGNNKGQGNGRWRVI